LIVGQLVLRDYRSYERLELELEPGTVLVVGPNGAGKTNLLEALHVGTQGFSPRTRVDGQLVRFGADAARVSVTGHDAGSPVQVEVTLARREGKRVRVNGAAAASADELRQRLTTLVFTPDRLAVVKGGPAVRRAYFDRTLGRLLPARATLPGSYGAAVTHRNAALRRAGSGHGPVDAVAPWTEQVAQLGADLVEARAHAVGELALPFAEAATELGLEDARLVYEAEAPTVEQLDAQLPRDLERGWTGAGPHLDDVGLAAGQRDLRLYGSQGEQRLAVLSLLLAEAELLSGRGRPPLLLLDDVLSELDTERRRALAARVARGGQTVITATAEQALPATAAQVVVVEPGAAVSRGPA
jgi:DNA replication and repair protein RecF